MVMWDTFGLFETLLSSFEAALSRARIANPEATIELLDAIAAEGFHMVQTEAVWQQDDGLFIRQRVERELSPEALEWFEDEAPAVAAFSCFALGALLGKLAIGEIDTAGFTLGDAHLPGFVLLHSESIYSKYRNSG